MLCILTRLPVKSILRFKSVCKPWCKLFATRKFMKMHQYQFSKNQAAIIYNRDDHTMSLVEIESNEKKPTKLDEPYPEILSRMNVVGCCNGLLCMGIGQGIVLWNPAMKLFKFLRLSNVCFGVPEMVSLGFGYDAEGDDFKVVRIVCLKKKKVSIWVEVYSASSDSWRTVKVYFQFRVLGSKNHGIVNGNPYWFARIGESEGAKKVLVWFDVTKLVFKIVPLESLHVEDEAEVELVDWNGSLGALVFNENNKYWVCIRSNGWVESRSLDVWVFDDGQQIWRKNHNFGQVSVSVSVRLKFSHGTYWIDSFKLGKVYVCYPETGCVKQVRFCSDQPGCFRIYRYTESLAYIKGMKQVTVRKGRGR